MAVLLAMLAALGYGAGDFSAGLAGRRYASGPVTAVVQAFGVAAAVVAVMLFPGPGPTAGVFAWGALSGVGSAVGTLALYRGLAVGEMSVAATSSAVLTAVLPVVVGLALGDRVTALSGAGIALAVPAVALVSWQPGAWPDRGRRSGIGYGVLAGAGFALLFIALDRAGTASGAWPLLPGQIVALLLVLPFARGGRSATGRWRPAAAPAVIAGVLSGGANLLFLAATGHGQLAIVAVVTALYPAGTVFLARVVLDERWSRLQAAGLLTAAAAIVLVSAG